MEADFGRDFLETSNKILKTTDRMCKIALSLNRVRLNFLNLWTSTTIPGFSASLKKSGRNAVYTICYAYTLDQYNE